MNLQSYIFDAWNTIISNKLRSGLSSLGIIIGITSVVLMLSLGNSTKEQFLNNLWSISANSLTVTSSNTTPDRNSIAKALPLNNETVSFLESTFPTLSGQITYITSRPSTLKHQAKTYAMFTKGISPNYLSLGKEEFMYGRAFSEQEINEKQPVVVMSYSTLKDVFDNQNPIGTSVTIQGKPFTIIGVLKESTQERLGWSSVSAHFPYPIFFKEIFASSSFNSLQIFLPEESDNEQWRKIIYQTLLEYIGVTSTNDADFEVTSSASFADQIQSAMDIFSYFLAAVGGISLLVWWIGVMNIMIVSVTERTREIGIRKAIGALKKDIIMQFLIESIVLTSLGGIVAIIISYLIIGLINGVLILLSLQEGPFAGFRVSVSLGTLILALSLTTIVGVGFGITPAKKAAQLKPIDALRFE